MQTYRVIAPGIDAVRRGPNGEIKPNLRVMRPREGKEGPYTDSDDNPTLVTFDQFCQVDIDLLLTAGAIVPFVVPEAKVPPKSEATPPAKGGSRDEVGKQ